MKIVSGRLARPRRVMLYGTHGIGKSSWAAAAPKPFVLDLEDGLSDLDVDRSPLITSFGSCNEYLSWLGTADHGYRTVVIDPLDKLERCIHKTVAQDAGKRSVEDIGYGKGYILAVDKWEFLISSLEQIRQRGMSIILLAHARITRFADPNSDSYDRYEPDLHKSASSLLQEWCDEVFFATYSVRTVKHAEKFNQERVRAIGNGERVVYTTEMPTHLAKRRIPLPDEMPLDFSVYVEHLKAARNGNGNGNIAGVVTDGSSKPKENENG